ncbi:MAG TPA: PilZ domain-containing protein [Caulobacteraceae bacterium]|jgi:hypothetical protein|nr:PilZ domain-containing protein [Caulobacteraceae bacterium]
MDKSMARDAAGRAARYADVSFGERMLDGAAVRQPFRIIADRRAADRGCGDQRRSPRRRVLLGALVIRSDLSDMFRCGVHDVSDHGARLKIPSGLLLPADFWLIATSAGLAYEARTVWRGYPNVGVSVGDPVDLHDPASRIARKLRVLWMSVAG